jgi:hypothetical protein
MINLYAFLFCAALGCLSIGLRSYVVAAIQFSLALLNLAMFLKG